MIVFVQIQPYLCTIVLQSKQPNFKLNAAQKSVGHVSVLSNLNAVLRGF